MKDNKRNGLLCIMTVVALLCCSTARGLTLEACRQMARDNYPAIRQYSLVELSRDYTVSNATKAWLPQLSVAGSVTAFTDILDASSQMAAMGMDMKNWVASGMVTVRQNVYDGGQTAARQRVTKAEAEVQQRQLDVTMHQVADRVDELFFALLAIDEQLQQNVLLQSDLSLSANMVASMVRNGTATTADADQVEVERVKALQQHDALTASRRAYRRMLGTFIGQPVGDSTLLEKPTEKPDAASAGWGLQRPEMAVFTAESQLLDARRKQLDTRLRPTMSLFGSGMLHSRVSPMLNDGLLLGGLSLSWNIGALYTRKNDLKKLAVAEEQNNVQRSTFLFNNQLQNEDASGRLATLRQQLTRDSELVALRERIRTATEKRVQMGTETVSELMRQTNAVSQARCTQSLHHVELLRESHRMAALNE